MVLLIPLIRGKCTVDGHAVVDIADAGLVAGQRWSLSAKGYAYRSGRVADGCGAVLMHRQLLGLRYGEKPQGDHINRNRLDNRRENLRVVTQIQNSRKRTAGKAGA